MNRLSLIVCFLLICTYGCAQQTTVPSDAPVWKKMGLSEMIRTPDAGMLDFVKTPKWNYTNGLVCTAMEKIWKRSGDERFYNYMFRYADSMIDDGGVIKTYKPTEYNIDKVNSGKFLFALYEHTKDEKFAKAIHLLRDQMKNHPRTAEGGFWHKKIYPHQMWLDGLYMGGPFLAQYAQVFNEKALFDDVALQIRLVDKYTYDPKLNLFFHAWDESKSQKWANKTDGKSPHVWGRAMGWFAMALVDVLDFFPADHPDRAYILEVVNRMGSALIQTQDSKTGVWYQVMDQPDREGNYLEGSASCMFTYFLLKAMNKGYIDAGHKERIFRAYDGVLKTFIRTDADGMVNITQVCAVAGLGGNPYRDGSFEYYINETRRDNDPKAVGPFIMMALEYDSAVQAQRGTK